MTLCAPRHYEHRQTSYPPTKDGRHGVEKDQSFCRRRGLAITRRSVVIEIVAELAAFVEEDAASGDLSAFAGVNVAVGSSVSTGRRTHGR